jgi:hypothetical protein
MRQVPNLHSEEVLHAKAAIDYTLVTTEELDNIKVTRSKTSDRSAKEETSSNTSLKAWSSFPELNDNGPESSCGGVAALKTMTKTMRAKNTADKSVKDRISQSIELSDVIKVDYSETKAAGASMTTEAKFSTGQYKLH